MIPYSRQCVDDDDIEAVVGVLRGDWLTTGPAVGEFERAVAAYVGAEHCVAVNSGTAALHAALHAAGIGPGDTVATTTMSFSASANCGRYVGADVKLIDIDPETYNLDLLAVPDCDALVAVHFTGLPVALDKLATRPRVVIEDAAQALGAHTADGPVGNCARSDMTTFSFHPVKSITTGEGGAITTNDANLASRLRRFRNHGIKRRAEHGPWAYDIADLGYNLRLTDIQAALGTSQLRKLDRFIDRRTVLAERYRSSLADLDGVTLPPDAQSGSRHAYHLFVVQVLNRRQVYEKMRDAGIGVQVHHVPIHGLSIHHEPADRGFPHAEAFYAQALSLPLHPLLTDDEQDYVIATLRATLTDRPTHTAKASR